MIKQYLALLFITISVSACGSSQDITPEVSIESQFQPIVQNFVADAQTQGKPVTITNLIIQSVPSLPDEIMGECFSGGLSPPTIQISQEDWDVLTPDGQKVLLYHELGHCVLGRVHNYNENNGIPVSIMSPAYIGAAIYDYNKAEYLYELFWEQDLESAMPMWVPSNVLVPVMPTSPTVQ